MHSILYRFWMLVSPEALSASHGVHDESFMVSGQDQSPQVSTSSPHPVQVAPPFLGTGLVQERFLLRIPVPQVAVHRLQDPHSLHPPSTGRAV